MVWLPFQKVKIFILERLISVDNMKNNWQSTQTEKNFKTDSQKLLPTMGPGCMADFLLLLVFCSQQMSKK